MNLNKIGIGARLGAGYALVLALLLITMVASSMVATRSRAALVEGLNISESKTQAANSMKIALLETGISMRNMGMLTEVSEMEKEQERVASHRSQYSAAVERLASLGLDDHEQKIISDVAEIEGKIDGLLKQAAAKAVAFDTEGAGKIITSAIDPLTQKAQDRIDELVASERAVAKEVMQAAIAAGQHMMNLQLVAAIVSLAVGIACGWFITRSITVPLRSAVAIAKRVASGDLTARPDSAGSDEIAELMQSLREMNESLGRTVDKVRRGTESITTASCEIAAGNSDLSSRTEQQASALEETASAMGELTDAVKQNAESARYAGDLVLSASTAAAKGGRVVGEVVDTMGSIKASSSKISDIIGVIDGIAFQTNILALNAAVEAARAGEQGRGFAVVASEVRSLAQRSAGAAREIKELIENSVTNVVAGSELVDEAGRTMDEIVTSVKHVADIMSKISSASQEQSTGIEEVNRSIEKMEEMTQRNAALVEQVAAAAASMQGQAVNLEDSVSIFKQGAQSPEVRPSQLQLVPGSARFSPRLEHMSEKVA